MTTTELLMAALFAAIVLATLYGFYREQLFNLLSQEIKTVTLEDARGALDIMVRELRNAGSWATGTAPSGCQRFVMATATSIRIQADLDGDGDCDGATSAETGEDVTYDLSNSTPTCPGSTLRRNGNCLVANVVIPPGSQLFTYFDSVHVQLPASPPAASIKRVKIVFSVQVPQPTPQGKASGRTITSTLASSVEFRN
jgi:hypothetical protein